MNPSESFDKRVEGMQASFERIQATKPYPIVFGKPYKGLITQEKFVSGRTPDTRVKACDVPTPGSDLKDCSPMCSNHPDRLSQGTVKGVRANGKKKDLPTFWQSACSECLDRAYEEGFTIRWAGKTAIRRG